MNSPYVSELAYLHRSEYSSPRLGPVEVRQLQHRAVAEDSGPLYVHDGSQLQQGALWSNGAALRMQFLQVLQKASPLKTLQNDSVAGGQTDTGPVGEQRGQ